MSTNEKVLPGISRSVLAFITAHWRDLAKMSLIPFVVYFLGSLFQIKAMSSLYREMGTMMVGNDINPTFMGTYFRNMGISMLFSLLGLVAMCLLFVEIIRYKKSGDAPWIMLDGASLKAAVLTMLYAIGMFMLTMLAYMGVAMAVMIVFGILGAIIGAAAGQGIVLAVTFGILGIAAFAIIIGFLFWFMSRFFVGLPGVALGHSPDFFGDIWPLAKGESWGVPLRMLLASIVIYIPFIIIILLAVGVGAATFDFQKFTSNRPEDMFPAIADLMDSMAYLLPITMLFYAPFVWFMSLLLSEAFDRFMARNEKRGQVRK